MQYAARRSRVFCLRWTTVIDPVPGSFGLFRGCFSADSLQVMPSVPIVAGDLVDSHPSPVVPKGEGKYRNHRQLSWLHLLDDSFFVCNAEFLFAVCRLRAVLTNSAVSFAFQFHLQPKEADG